MQPHRTGITLLELVLALAIVALVAGTGVASQQRLAATRATRAAARDAAAAFAEARRHAIATGRATAVRLDATEGRLAVHAGPDTLRRLALTATHAVALTTTRDSMAYDGHGLGVGAANLTLVLSRPPAAETLVVSRLGRVRW